MKNLKFDELTAQQLENISGGLYPITERILNAIGALAAEMNNKMHEDPYWWTAFSH
ncbi:class IIb bacteriocin, lactobin A/cerein 7B family [Limibacterium fermenti]|uniref:class IIb bacteriocin, lactobin A/cerein 7B family n=1 Tax=Limibacterium fermenti TaxID=3229863 RepID=UPI000E95FDB8|nr:hypothetical protein [Porphyromonadaceae bacterium]